MAAKKEHVDVVLPTTGDGVEYEVISRKVTENAHYGPLSNQILTMRL